MTGKLKALERFLNYGGATLKIGFRQPFLIAICILPLFGASSAIAKDASEIFKIICTPCHGMNGEGKKPMGPPLKGSEFIKTSSDADVKKTIQNGRGGIEKKFKDFPAPMPPQKSLSETELDALVKYLKDLNGIAPLRGEESVSPTLPLTTERNQEKTEENIAPILEGKTLDGFWGVKFETSKTEAKKVMIAKGGKLVKDAERMDQLCFTNLKFGGRDVGFICLYFDNDRFYQAGVALAAPLEAKTLSLYDEIKVEINDKYYFTTKDYRVFRYPYEEGDGHEITAIKIGKATITAIWEFPAEDVPNEIMLTIFPDLTISISYEYGKLAEVVREKQKAKNLKDY